MRLLHGFWRKRNVGEAAVFALEHRIVAGPQFFEGADVFVADRPTLVVRGRANGLKLFAHPPHTAADDEAPVGKHVNRR
jgi:hypothetical protein